MRVSVLLCRVLVRGGQARLSGHRARAFQRSGSRTGAVLLFFEQRFAVPAPERRNSKVFQREVIGYDTRDDRVQISQFPML